MTARDRELGFGILNDPRRNKSTAFTEEERDRLNLRGLLPPRVGTQRVQVERNLENLRRKTNNIEKFIFLQSLLARNERLFYRLVMDHIEEITPLIYTPTVGQACQEFAQIFRQSQGLYVTDRDRGHVRALLDNWPTGDVRVAVVTDGERILGLGDLGANGMGIPLGKLSLYTALGGIPPEQTLPIMLDVGTNNETLRADPLYLGLDQPRVRGSAYLALVDELMVALDDAFPDCLVQFEDFATPNAYTLLDRYKDTHVCFNDDIQGTASVALAGLLAAGRVTGKSLAAQTYLFLGAGSAATGIGDLLVEALAAEGMDRQQARAKIWYVDVNGLVVASRSEEMLPHNLPYAHDHPHLDFASAVDALRPDVLIGASGAPGTFNEHIVRTLARHHERPVIFALSNPTSRAECTAEQAWTWTGGRAVFASGSPFAPVSIGGRTLDPGQGNNAYVFPGLGLGAIASRASRISTAMFLKAARCLAKEVTETQLEQGRIYPRLADVHAISLDIAVAVAEQAWEEGNARADRPDDLRSAIAGLRFDPSY